MTVRAGVAAAGVAVAGAAVGGVVGHRRRRAALAEIDPELLTPFDWLPAPLTNRAVLAYLRSHLPPEFPPGPGARTTRRRVPTEDGRVLLAYVHEPEERAAGGVVLWLHGGGLVLGRPEVDHRWCSRLARELGVVVVAPAYRLAPEHPFPAALDDAYAALVWARTLADGPLMVGGSSAGGGLAASLAQLARDRGGPPIARQVLQYPMLDDRTALRRDHDGRGRVGWSPRSNRFGWTCYLGRAPGEHAPAYAAAARMADLAGLPPAWIGVGERDLFHDEDVAYAGRLADAGVPCTLRVVPRMHHGADAMADRGVASMVAFRQAMVDAFADGLA